MACTFPNRCSEVSDCGNGVGVPSLQRFSSAVDTAHFEVTTICSAKHKRVRIDLEWRLWESVSLVGYERARYDTTAWRK